ncbi:hypothetical protein ACIPJN_32885 [Streptomyces sp. NPDC086796]|uniref:hypothetical protein n=1 Tax=unclassified Streptomyces TaxID=2593676 RepID=UPI0038108215
MKRRTFLAGTTAVSVPAMTATTAVPAAASPSATPLSGADTAAALRLVIDGVPHDLPPTTVYQTTIEATGTAGRTRVTMAGAYSEFSVAFPSPYAPHLARVSVWLTGVTPKRGNLWLKVFDQDNEEWGTLASRVDPTGFDGRTRVTFEPQRLSRMTWSGVADGRLTYPLRRLVLVFFPDDKQSADPFVFDMESVEVVGDGGPVSTWTRAGALELTSGADRVLIDGRGRLLDWTSGGRIQSPGVLPLAVYYDNGTGVFSDEAEVDVARVAADEAAVGLTVPGFFTAELTVRLRAGRLELRPTAIRNLWSRPILSVACPEVAYRVIPADGTMLGIAPKWGGLAHTRSVLAGGFYANYGMPTATHDLILFEEDDSALGVYSVQPASVRPYRPTQFGFVGGRARDEALTGLMHRVDAWTVPGGSERLPATRLVAGASAFDLFAAYRADNGMNTWRGLTDKLGPRLRAGLADSVHLKVDLWQPTGGTSATGRPEAAFEYLRAVPGGPYSVELASYYSDGQHDHHYPDFLTFDYLGGPAEFRRLIDTIHDRGHYASAYTNPTWWHPDSRAVAALGGVERIGIRDRRGKLVTKTHTNNLGYLIGGWRKAPRALILGQLRTFRDTYGMDMMFQDEIARREYDYAADFCAPPYAYCEELVEQTAQSAAILPIGTEGVGGDRIFQSLTSSLGFYLNTMQGDRASTYDGPNRNGVVVQQWPLGTAVMHDKVAFYPHNLDRGVDTSENLSWALAFGLNLHYQAQHMTADFRAGRGFELLKGLRAEAGRRPVFRAGDDGLPVPHRGPEGVADGVRRGSGDRRQPRSPATRAAAAGRAGDGDRRAARLRRQRARHPDVRADRRRAPPARLPRALDGRPVRARTRLVSGGSGGVPLRLGARRPPAHRHTGRTPRGHHHQGGAGPRRVGRDTPRPGRREHRLGARRAARRTPGHRRRRERLARAGARRCHRLGDGTSRRHP